MHIITSRGGLSGVGWAKGPMDFVAGECCRRFIWYQIMEEFSYCWDEICDRDSTQSYIISAITIVYIFDLSLHV